MFGIILFIILMVVLLVSIGLINFFFVLIFDGGYLLFYGIEVVNG